MWRKVFITVMLMFLAILLLRKLGVPLSPFFLALTGVVMSVIVIYNGLALIFNQNERTHKIEGLFYFLSGLYTLLLLSELQYWISLNQEKWLFLVYIFILLILLIVFWKSESTSGATAFKFPLLIFIILCLLSIPILILNPRELHNLFRSSKYEEYLRNKLPETSMNAVDMQLVLFKDNSEEAKKSAAIFFQKATEAERNKSYEAALTHFNSAIDLNPEDPTFYFSRGCLKLYHLDINQFIATSALKDFSEAIHLDPGMASAWYQRSMVYGYLKNIKHACKDLQEAFRLDSTLDVRERLADCEGSGGLSPE